MSPVPKRVEVDPIAWRPSASLETLRRRSRLLSDLRRFFLSKGIQEVETPACSVAATSDPALESLQTVFTGPGAPAGKRLYLHTSPEFAMKRLLCAGCGSIFQICKVFRNGELGSMHAPEFTLLEWYRLGIDHHRLMDEVAELIRTVLPDSVHEQRFSYRELFLHHIGIDPLVAPVDALRHAAGACGIGGLDKLQLEDRDAWLDLLMTHCIEPALGTGMCFVYDYPASQASLARIRPGTPPLAERFELYLDGVELANGFHELNDGAEQRRRFQAELRYRRRRGLPAVPLDERFLSALDSGGLPDCAGVALGVDRLLMGMVGAQHIDQVLAFPPGLA